MKHWPCLGLIVLALALWAGKARGQDASPLSATAVYSQDFTRAPLGPLSGALTGDRMTGGKLPGGVYDNTYAGGPTPMSVVRSGDPRLGNVLEVRPHGFAQIVLGEMALKKDTLYRVSLDIASRGPQRVTLTLRYIPAPYTGYITSQENTSETMRHVSFLGRCPADSSPVGLFLNMNGFTTLTIDNIKVEEVTGGLPPGLPPMAGNLLPNAGFEIGGDGWFTRGPVELVAAPDAYEGRRVAVMHGVNGQDILSSTFMRLSFGSDYLAQARVKARAGSPHAHIFFAGKDAGLTLNQADGWKVLALRVRPQPPTGKIVPYLDQEFGIECRGAGAQMLVDSVSVQAVAPGQGDAPYRPKAPLELGVSTDAPQGTLTAGEAATAMVLASSPLSRAELQVRDEDERVVRVLPLRFANGQAQVRLTGLPPAIGI